MQAQCIVRRVCLATVILAGASWVTAADGAAAAANSAARLRTVQAAYPRLSSGPLATARLAELPQGVMLRSGDLTVTEADIEAEIGKAPYGVAEQLRANAFFVLEQLAAKGLLARDAKSTAAKAGKDVASRSESELVQERLQAVATSVQVAEPEVAAFYAANKDMFCGKGLADVKTYVEELLREQKQEEAVDQHVSKLVQNAAVEVSAKWVEAQSAGGGDNPIERARASGKPTVAVFSSSSCCGPDKMGPVVDQAQAEYGERLNVVSVNARQEQVMTMRYKVHSIPLLVFYAADGAEVFRRTGFIEFADFQKELLKVGIR